MFPPFRYVACILRMYVGIDVCRYVWGPNLLLFNLTLDIHLSLIAMSTSPPATTLATYIPTHLHTYIHTYIHTYTELSLSLHLQLEGQIKVPLTIAPVHRGIVPGVDGMVEDMTRPVERAEDDGRFTAVPAARPDACR